MSVNESICADRHRVKQLRKPLAGVLSGPVGEHIFEDVWLEPFGVDRDLCRHEV